jgi:hypothetical protein
MTRRATRTEKQRARLRGVYPALTATLLLVLSIVASATAVPIVGTSAEHSGTTSRALTASSSGLSLTGPLTYVALCTKYSYRVSVLARKSYRHAVLTLNASAASVAHQQKTINLVAHRKWTRTFSETFTTTTGMNKGIAVTVTVLPPHHGYMLLTSRTYPVTPAPNQSASCTAPPPPYFGS